MALSTNVDMGRSLRRRIVPGSRIMSIRVGETVRSVVNPIHQRESQFSIFCPSIVTLPVLDPLVCTIYNRQLMIVLPPLNMAAFCFDLPVSLFVWRSCSVSLCLHG